MKTLVFLLLTATSILFGHVAVTENEPSALIEGVVSAVTGDLYALEDDIIIQGAEPLRLKRNYISAQGEGGWHLIENLFAHLRPRIRKLRVWEPNGTGLDYSYKIQEVQKKKHRKKKTAYEQYVFHPLNLSQDAKGLTNTGRGKISASTNLKNQFIQMQEQDEGFTVFCPNGVKRHYVAIPDQKPERIGPKKYGFPKIFLDYYYVLQSEELLNGNKIHYDWNRGQLQSIRTTDPSGQKTYAQAVFHYHGKLKEKGNRHYLDNADFEICTSDGRILHYHFVCEGKPENQGRWQIKQIASSDFPMETMHYHGPENNRQPILAALTLPCGRGLHVGYYQSGNDPTCSRVQSLASPVGRDTVLLVTHRFQYNLPKRQTIVLDVNGTPTKYSWDENLRLCSIERNTQANALGSGMLFVWGAGQDEANLLCKTLFDENRKPVHATSYVYDTHGNIIVEQYYGDLSGQGTSPTLDSLHMPINDGDECYSNKFDYSQDGRNLLLRKEEGNGLMITYDYLAGTDLPLAELSYENGCIKRRKFYEYNSDRILIREITDDGDTSDKNDVNHVSTRKILQIHPKQDSPYLNMPQVIEEKYWDGDAETLLKKTILHYTTGGRIERKDIYDASGTFSHSLTYRYDEKGNLREETNALGQTAISSYDELGNKIFFQDFGNSSHVEMEYDYSNRPIVYKEMGEDGFIRITRHEYDKKHNKILTIDPYGYETSYVYDEFNQLIETHLPAMGDVHPVIRSNYDAPGREIKRTDAKGYTTQTNYNAYGKPTSILHPNDTSQQFFYNLDGTLREEIDQNGIKTHYTYDVFRRKTAITKSLQEEILVQEILTHDAYHLIAKTDAEGNVTTYEYDGAGRKIAEELNNERIEYKYDLLGRLYQVKQGELLTITEHDLLDRVLEERKEDLTGNVLSKVLYTYDNAGNRNTITRFIDGKKAIERLEYDSFNRLIKKEDPLGNTTTTAYDDTLHRQITSDPLGLQTIESFNSHYLSASIEKRSSRNEMLVCEKNLYDGNENLIAKETTIFDPYRTVTTTWDYGPLDQLYTLTEGAGTAEQKITLYAYTPTGQLFQTVKSSGIVLTNTYDPLQHLESQTSSDGSINYTYFHNRLGHLIKSVDERNQTLLTRSYDPKGRLLSEKLSNSLAISNRYDVQGRRIRLDLPDGSFISCEYDPLYLRRVTRLDTSGNLVYSHIYTNYDLSGNLLSQELIGNLGSISRSYDLAGRPTSATSPNFAHNILEYDEVGNVLRSKLHNEFLQYTYDDLYQLTSEKEHIYTHDALHNRVKKDTVSYAINALNQLPSEFTYNSDGNPCAHGDIRYTYDALDRLISIENKDQKLLFTYDSYHRRVSKMRYARANGTWKQAETRFFLYDGQNEIGSVDDSGNFQELRVLGRTPQAEIGAAIAVELKGKIFAPFHDLYGNVAQLIALSGSTCEKYRYSAFGEERDQHVISNPWRFSSKRIDDETGLVYFGRRYYLPSHGRWLTPDPLGFDAGPNLYAYVFNAPLTHVDLYGLLVFEDVKQTGIGALHGFGNFALNGLTAVGTAGWGLTVPVRAFNWISGRSSFSQDWNNIQSSNRALLDAGDRWMHRAIQGDINHAAYHTLRGGVSGGLELTTIFATGGTAIGKGAYSLFQKAPSLVRNTLGLQKIARPTTSITMGLSSGAENVNAGINLTRKLSQLETAQQSFAKVRFLCDSRIRYYGAEIPAVKIGLTRGRGYVTEFDMSSGRVRTWMECYNHSGVVNRVHPKQINGQNLVSPHYPPTARELGIYE